MTESMDWGFSSSSQDSDSGDELAVSKFRRSTPFYQQHQNREYGANWPSHLFGYSVNQRTDNGQGNNSTISDSNGHISFADISRIPALDDSRIVSPGTIFGNAPDDIVLVNEGGKYRPIRVIFKQEILPPRRTPDGKSKMPNAKIEPEEDDNHVPREIPLEIIDFIDVPKDPRTRQRDEFGDEDSDYGLPMPRFYYETTLNKAMAKNRERNVKLNGAFKLSNSYVRQRALQQSKRQSMLPARRTDPRLEKSLFAGRAPRKVSPPKTLNRSQPNSKPGQSIFDFEADSLSSVSSSFSSPDESFGSSLPSAPDNSCIDHNSTASNIKDDSLDTSSDDNDCSFTAFKKRKTTMKGKQPAKRTKTAASKEGKVPPIKIDLKKKKVSSINRPGTRQTNKLFGKPPHVDQQAILTALTDEAASEDQEIVPANTNHTVYQSNKKVEVAPVECNHNLKMEKPSDTANVDTVNAENIMNIIVFSSDDQNSEMKKIANVESKETTGMTEPELDPQSNEFNMTSSSISSIEQQLAAMTSPVKTAAELHNELNVEERLADILSEGNEVNGSKGCMQPAENYQRESNVGDWVFFNSVEGSEIVTAVESPPFESHPKLMDKAVKDDNSDGSDKNDQQDMPSTAENVGRDTVSPANLGTDVAQGEPVDAPVSELLAQTQICQEKEHAVDPANEENTSEMETSSAILNFDLPDISTNGSMLVGIENIILSDLGSLSIDDIGQMIESDLPDNSSIDSAIVAIKPPAKKPPQRAKIIIKDYSEIGDHCVASLQLASDIEISDDDYEDDQPCGMDELILPNSNTDRNTTDQNRTRCSLCSFQATKGWKQLTKHYVRKHAGKEISVSRLDKVFNPQELMSTTFTPIITKGPAGTMIQSLCYICNERYNMCSSKWLSHFIAHTGEFEFRCNKCHKVLLQDLHKRCNSKHNERINGPHDFIDNVLYGYVCALCSYVQLSKKNVTTHSENEHQLLNTGDENITEIILLKSTQPIDFLTDDKNQPDLVEAKQRVPAFQQPSRYDNFDPIEIPDDDESEPEISDSIVATVDLTLSDDE